jgi:hypothetical protein
VPLKAIAASVVSASRDPKLAPFGASTLDVDLYPHKHLARIMGGLLADGGNQFPNYEHAQGSSDLRRLLAQRLVRLSPDLDPDQVINYQRPGVWQLSAHELHPAPRRPPGQCPGASRPHNRPPRRGRCTSIDGRGIKVNEAKPKPPRDNRGGGGGYLTR